MVAEGRAEEEEVAELGFVRFSRGLGRKRILISSGGDACPSDWELDDAPLKRQRGHKLVNGFEGTDLESLPQDVLVKILCFVDHDDLRNLFMVSKSIREASLIANHWHFAYTTPKRVPVCRNSLPFDTSEEFTDTDSPNAPQRLFRKQGLSESLVDIARVLFPEAET